MPLCTRALYAGLKKGLRPRAILALAVSLLLALAMPALGNGTPRSARPTPSERVRSSAQLTAPRLFDMAASSAPQWLQQTSPTSAALYSAHFTDANTGWVVGDAGTILKTGNGGTTWTAQTSGTTKYLSSIHFTDANTGWAVGDAGTILKTGNGGTTWTAQTSGTTKWLRFVHFTDANTGWAVGYAGTILKTGNGGTTWTAQTSGTTQYLNEVHFTDANTGWVVGSSGTILKAAPVASTLMPVWRFYNFRTGTHFYTADPGEMANVAANMRNIYSLDGVGYTVNTANTANSTTLWRFYNKKTGTHFYTADTAEKANVENNMRATYVLDGPAYKVSSTNVGGTCTVVWRFYNFRTGTHFYTADAAEKANVQNNMRNTYSLDGAGFY